MAYARGHRGDYDRWAQKGARWLVPCRRASLFQTLRDMGSGENTWRGGSGPIGTEFAKTRDPLYEAWIEAAKVAGVL
jgi:choline dehydrogenase-like flavoprotein